MPSLGNIPSLRKIPSLGNAFFEENSNLRNAVSHGTTCCSSPPLVTCIQVLVFLYSVFHWRNHQQKRFCRVVTPIAIAPIAVRLIALTPIAATSMSFCSYVYVVTPIFHRIVNRSGRSFVLFVRSEGNTHVALAWKFRSQRWP